MANFIDAAPTNMFQQGLFGSLSHSSLSYLTSQIDSLATLGTEYGKALYERSKRTFEAVNGSAAVQAARSLLMQAQALGNDDVIRPLLSLDQIQAAPLTMQNWIMTSPMLRQAWMDGKISGYVDTYNDPEPGRIGEDQHAWRILHDGVLQDTPEDSEHDWKVSHYHEQLEEHESPLSILDITAIFQTQQRAEMIYELGKDDPTSQYGESL